MAKNLLNKHFSEPLNGVTAARVEITAGDGNLMVDRLEGDEQALASGDLQYFENQGAPEETLDTQKGEATFTLSGNKKGQRWLRMPWDTCNGATVWHVQLNPKVASDITARSGGGNVKLDLGGMSVTRLVAGTGGGNLEVALPANARSLVVTAQTGAGNVVVHVPSGLAACVHATTGLGKVIVDPQLQKTGKDTYQSSDFDHASNRVEITATSGAGNVIVDRE